MRPLNRNQTSIPVTRPPAICGPAHAWARKWVRNYLAYEGDTYEARRHAADMIAHGIALYGIADAEWIYAYVLIARLTRYRIHTAKH